MIYFIINPAAGSGQGKEASPVIERLMNDKGAAYSIIFTQKPDDFDRVYGLIDYDIAQTIVCVGGDGTIQEYVGLAAGRDVNFCIIPVGCGNDLMYSLPGGVVKIRSLEDKIAYYAGRIDLCQTIAVDAAKVNGRYYFNIAGTGVDIQVLRDALPLKKRFGGFAYFIALVKNVLTYRAERMAITIDAGAGAGDTTAGGAEAGGAASGDAVAGSATAEVAVSVGAEAGGAASGDAGAGSATAGGAVSAGAEPESDEFTVLAVCNGAYYGGHMKICPPSVIDDGLLTICKIRKMPRLKMVAMFPLVKSGGHTRLKEVSFVNCSSIKVEFDGKKTINLDGNLYDMESPLTFAVLKGAVRLIV